MRTLKVTITDEETKTNVASQVTFDQINQLAADHGIDTIRMIIHATNQEMNKSLGQDIQLNFPDDNRQENVKE